MLTPLERLSAGARVHLASVLLDAGNPNNLTAAIVVDTLADKANLLEQFPGLAAAMGPAFPSDWQVVAVPVLGRAWVVRWDHLTAYVPDTGDGFLPWRLMFHRSMARHYLRTIVVDAAIELGLPRHRFLRPASR